MLIVSGRIFVKPEDRDRFLKASRDATIKAREAPGCQDFVVAADPVEPDRINVYEEWNSIAELEAFRGSGPEDELSRLITKADVRQWQVERS